MTHVHNATHREHRHTYIHSLHCVRRQSIIWIKYIISAAAAARKRRQCLCGDVHAYFVLKRTTLSLAEPNCRRGVSLVRRILHIDLGKLFLMVRAAFIRMKAIMRDNCTGAFVKWRTQFVTWPQFAHVDRVELAARTCQSTINLVGRPQINARCICAYFMLRRGQPKF